MKKIIGLDIGGTYIRAAMINGRGEILKKETFKTKISQSPEKIIKQLKDIIKSLIDDEMASIGIGVPGRIEEQKGLIVLCPNLPSLNNLKLAKIIKDEFKIPAMIENDASCALVGEMWQGTAKDSRNVCLLTLGTGIGGAVAIDGKIYRGSRGMAGEFGHLILDPSGPACNCGQQGCLEAFWQERTHEDEYLALGLINLWTIFDPQKIILSGGIADDNKLHLVEHEIKKYSSNHIILELAKLGEWSGVVGAAKIAMDNINNNNF